METKTAPMTFAGLSGTVKDTPMTRESQAEQFRFASKDSITARQDKVQAALNELDKGKGKGKDDKGKSCLGRECWIREFAMDKVIYNDGDGETYGRSYTIDKATGEVSFGAKHEVESAGWVKAKSDGDAD